ncbi:MAG: Ig-like domain-containing protein [Luteolibacter sp.]
MDAAHASDTNRYWNDLVDGNPTGFGLLLDKSKGNVVTRQAITGSNTQLSHAFQFPGGKVENVGGAQIVETNTGIARSFNNAGWHTQPVSFEIWFRPDNINPSPTNGQILFEDGDHTTGISLSIRSNNIRFRKTAGGGEINYNLDTDADELLLGAPTGEFIQVIATYNTTGVMELFINGASVGTTTTSTGNWASTDRGAFATRGGLHTGAIGSQNASTQSFQGQIAMIRAYRNRVLTAAEVKDNFDAIVGIPVIRSLNPSNGDPAAYPGGNLVAALSKEIELTGTGSVTIRNLDDGSGSSDVTINLPDASVTVDGRNLVIVPPAPLNFETTYAVHISQDAVTDLMTPPNPFNGIQDDVTWSFTTTAHNTDQLVITSRNPDHLANQVAIGTTIVATFDQNLVIGTGDIVIKDLEDDSTTQTIPVDDPSQVSVADNVLSIKPGELLEANRSYAVLIDSTALRNFSDVGFPGITSDSEWTFTTSLLGGQLDILDLTANNNINPATGEPWKPGDRFRMVFVSSTNLNPRDTTFPSAFGSWNSIDTWNAEAQSFANNAVGQDLSGASWKVLGSTSTVNARDNTKTNPAVHGSGHPIVLIDGKTIVASDFTELWGGEIWDSITLTENIIDGVNEVRAPFPLTGTNVFGVNLGSGGSLRDISGGGNIRQGQSGNLRGWIDRANYTVSASSNSANPIYAMSDPLFVIDLNDNVAPSLVSFANNVGGGPLPFPDPGSVVYTVSFDEMMMPGTITESAFGNAGTASILINSVAETGDPAVYQVTVAPTSEGTLQLQIVQDAVITDLAGNALDTSTAILDDTVIQIIGDSPFQTWLDSFPGLTDPDPTVDFDGGGLATALEWVLGGDPTNANDDVMITPTFDNTSDPDFFVFTYRRTQQAAADTNTTILVEYSSDLVAWTTAAAGADVQINVNQGGAGTGIDLVEVKIRRTIAQDGKLFSRLRVELAQP